MVEVEEQAIYILKKDPSLNRARIPFAFWCKPVWATLRGTGVGVLWNLSVSSLLFFLVPLFLIPSFLFVPEGETSSDDWGDLPIKATDDFDGLMGDPWGGVGFAVETAARGKVCCGPGCLVIEPGLWALSTAKSVLRPAVGAGGAPILNVIDTLLDELRTRETGSSCLPGACRE